MSRIFVAITATGFALSACGSADTTRYALPGDAIGPGSEFATQNVKRSVYVNGSQSLKDQTVSVRFSTDGQKVYISQNHKDYVLVNDGTGLFTNSVATFFLEDVSTDVDIAWFRESTPNYSNTGAFIVGYHTNPAQVAAQNGTATFNGITTLDADTNTLFGYGYGQVALTANFDSNTLTGTMNIVDSGSSSTTLVLPDTTVIINPTSISNISGNTFKADLGISFAATPGNTATVSQSGLEGGFYGVNAAGVGATYWATGTLNGENLYIQGALAAN